MGRREIDVEKQQIIDAVPFDQVMGVNNVIDALRREFYAPRLGYVPPLVSGETRQLNGHDEPTLRRIERTALRRAQVQPTDLPALSFLEEIGDHEVTLANFSAQILPLLDNPVRRRVTYFDPNPDFITELVVGADVRTLGGNKTDTRMHIGYTLFLPRKGGNLVTHKAYGDRLPSEEIQSGAIRPLFYRSTRLNIHDPRSTMGAEDLRHAGSRARATALESRRVVSPASAGLGSGGKRS